MSQTLNQTEKKSINTSKMVFIPGGKFLMGSDKFYPEEKPVREVTVDGFWIDKYEVTNEDFQQFISETGYITVAERPLNPADYPGAKPELLVPGALVFRKLYDLSNVPTESNNIAKDNRPKLIEMIAQWYVEAGKYNVLPIDSRGVERLADPRPQIAGQRTSYTYYPGTQVIPGNAAVNLMNRPFSITIDVEIPAGGAEGVMYSMGGNDGGLSFFIQEKKLHYLYNYAAAEYFHAISKDEITEGRHQFRLEFEVTGKPDFPKGKGAPGTAQLYIDDKLSGEEKFPYTLPLALGLGSGVSVGSDPGSPTSPEYKPPFKFTGTIHTAVVDVSGELIEDEEATAKVIMARQ